MSDMHLPSNIDDVLSALDDIIKSSIADDNYLGIFAYVYRRTTAEIRARVEAGEFDDNPRMQALDVVFANLYIKAYYDYRSGNPVSKAWKLCFDRSREKLTLIQHLLLGMNAHINLDLAVAANSVMQGKPIGDIAVDFKSVNAILSDITDELQSRLGRVSPLLFLLDWIGQRSDEKIADFSILAAREFSWHTAVTLRETEPDLLQGQIDEVDNIVAGIGKRFVTPRTRVLKLVLKWVGRFESTDKQLIIAAMRG